MVTGVEHLSCSRNAISLCKATPCHHCAHDRSSYVFNEATWIPKGNLNCTILNLLARLDGRVRDTTLHYFDRAERVI
ncbi:unnamed protein product [Urochloa humidicola]